MTPPDARGTVYPVKVSTSAVVVLGRAFLRSSRPWTLACLGTVLVLALLPVALMVVSGHLVSAVASLNFDAAVVAVCWFIGLSLLMTGTTAVHSVAQAELSQRFVTLVEISLASTVMAPAQIDHLENPDVRGRIDAAAESSREGVHLAAVGAYFQTIQWRISGFAATVLLLTYSWWVAPALLVGYLILTWSFRRWLATVYGDLTEVLETSRRKPEYLRRLLVEPAAAKEIRIFSALPWLDGRFGETWKSAMAGVWQRRRGAAAPLAIGVVALVLAHAAVFGWLGYEAFTGALAAGQVVVIVQAAAGMEDLSRYGDVGAQLGRAGHALNHLNALSAELEPTTRAVRPSPSTNDTAVELTDVSFTYPGRTEPVLRDLHLSVPAGQALAVVGANGAGKSTLVKLLGGLYQPDEGDVRVQRAAGSSDDQDQVAVIYQTFGRYELSLRDNIAFGNWAARDDDETLIKALTEAGGADLLDRLELDTVLSAGYPDGTDLSGGQWQRVALARSLVALQRGARLLILDEPTSGLDVRAETSLFERFLDVTRGATTILVSHRLNSVRHADRIVVLDDGHIVEDGSHDELIAADGHYATMFALQARRFVAGGQDA